MSTTPRSAILDELLKFLFDKPMSELDIKLKNILANHRMSHESGLGAFFYKGAHYAEPDYRPKARQRIPMLRGELTVQMDQYRHQQSELDKERNAAVSVFSCVLSRAHSKADCLALLPAFLHGCINKFSEFGESVISPEEANEFHIQYGTHYSSIKQRMMLNLIT